TAPCPRVRPRFRAVPAGAIRRAPSRQAAEQAAEARTASRPSTVPRRWLGSVSDSVNAGRVVATPGAMGPVLVPAVGGGGPVVVNVASCASLSLAGLVATSRKWYSVLGDSPDRFADAGTAEDPDPTS